MKHIIKEMFKEMPIITYTMLFLIFLISFICFDIFKSNKEIFNGIIVDKHYKAEVNKTGYGYGTTSNGGSGVIITNSNESEKFLIMVKNEQGHVLTVDCDSDLYYTKEIGSNVECIKKIGKYTNTVWSIEAIN